MKTIKWGIIGVGDVCEVKSGPGFQKAPNSKLVAVMRRNGDKAKDFAKRHGVPKWSDNAETLLSDPEINAIYIATPPLNHLEYTQAALAAGKDVYVEKPMARNGDEAQLIQAADEASPHKVCVAHYRRRLALFMEVQKVLQSGELGRPRHVSLQLIQPEKNNLIVASEDNWRVRPEVSGGGLFHDLAPHQLDLLLMYFGEPQVIQGFSTQRNPEGSCDDCVSGQMRFAGDVHFQGHWDFASSDGTVEDTCTIACDLGSLTFRFFRSPTLVVKKDQGIETTTIEPPQHIQQPMIEAVNAYFAGQGDNPCSTDTGVKVMKMIDAFITTR
ncbi:MAG: Gfo/Idh/MocA family oxidoreductase [Verrucomicrobia bacterium]|nr:Gfo/Idh/MocA family oxidoreductase [Verrucomicrobiota bacterium]